MSFQTILRIVFPLDLKALLKLILRFQYTLFIIIFNKSIHYYTIQQIKQPLNKSHPKPQVSISSSILYQPTIASAHCSMSNHHPLSSSLSTLQISPSHQSRPYSSSKGTPIMPSICVLDLSENLTQSMY